MWYEGEKVECTISGSMTIAGEVYTIAKDGWGLYIYLVGASGDWGVIPVSPHRFKRIEEQKYKPKSTHFKRR